jgi:hypothetical protein
MGRDYDVSPEVGICLDNFLLRDFFDIRAEKDFDPGIFD